MKNQLTADEQKRQDGLLKNGDGWDCRFFARDVEGADKEALMARYDELTNN